MSLLIKALDQAEKAQSEQLKDELLKAEQLKAEQLQVQQTRRRAGNIANHAGGDADIPHQAPAPEYAHETATRYNTQYDNPAVQAAHVFEAKQPTKASINPILWFVAFGVLALMAIGFYFYYQLNHLQAPAPLVVSPVNAQTSLPVNSSVAPPTQASQTPAPATPPASASNPAGTQATTQAVAEPLPPSALPPEALSANQVNTPVNVKPSAAQTQPLTKSASVTNAMTNLPVNVAAAKQAPNIQLFALADNATNASTNDTLTATESVVRSAPAPMVKASSNGALGQGIASKSASMSISKSNTQLGISPDLTRAYNAYVAGNDSEAQALYKRVLQRDVRNVDALLGMGAIAERQGRLPDALGWYQKVLEVEPRNPTALTAYYAQTEDKQDKELKLKNLIANAPNSANVYADLADYYAENNQWPEAQQAYFEAYRLNKSAENTFNLAVSLDQLGKPALALAYYQEALALSANAPNNSIDQSALQKRIAAIQAD